MISFLFMAGVVIKYARRSVNLKGKTDAEVEAPILWPPDVKGQLIGKDSDAGKD